MKEDGYYKDLYEQQRLEDTGTKAVDFISLGYQIFLLCLNLNTAKAFVNLFFMLDHALIFLMLKNKSRRLLPNYYRK